jgi:hypothetical protein
MDRGAGCSITSFDMGVKFKPDAWSAAAHEELTHIPTVDNAMASMHAALTKAFVFVV